MNSKKPFFYSDYSKEEGYALPLILLIGTIIAIASSGLISTSIQRLTSSKFKKFESMARNSADSGLSIFRALLNDSSKGFYYYFWLVDSCGEGTDSSQCPIGTNGEKVPGGYPPDPSKTFWIDEKWCDNVNGCKGRQKAPLCSYSDYIDWNNSRLNFGKLIDSEKDIVGSFVSKSNIETKQAFNIKTTEYFGNEFSGYNLALVEGLLIRKGLNQRGGAGQASNTSIKAKVSVSRMVPKKGFGFIGAGANENDYNSIFLGNISVTGDGLGSIIWRRNLPSIYNNISRGHSNFLKAIRADGSKVPNPYKDEGGIWIQPLAYPERPKLYSLNPNVKNKTYLTNYISNSVVCLNSNNLNSQYNKFCNFDTLSQMPRVIEMDSLYVKGNGAIFSITTSESSPATLIIKEDIDISSGGKFCHRNKSINAFCGSGKPENLTIIIDSDKIVGGNNQGVVCNRGLNSKGGIKATRLSSSHKNSILINDTGNLNEKFSAFIYAPGSTFISSVNSNDTGNYSQRTIIYPGLTNYPRRPANNGTIVVSKGGFYKKLTTKYCLRKSEGKWSYPRLTKCIHPGDIKSPITRSQIPYENTNDLASDPIFRGKSIIADGFGTNEFNSVNNMFLVYDRKTKNYELWGYGYYGNDFLMLNKNQGRTGRATSRCLSGNPYGTCHRIPLGPDPTKGPLAFTPSRYERAGVRGKKVPRGYRWIDHYNIGLSKRDKNKVRNFSGSAWVKNFCMDKTGYKTWDFSGSYIDGLVARYGSQFNWGVPYYRGQNIELWDTLRRFEN